MEINKKIQELIVEIKNVKPLVHHITNYVTVNDCANIVLAIGGSPVMADSVEEVEDMVKIASALVINIGTLNERTLESMIKAGRKANEIGIPVILDPVGIGATPYRKAVSLRLIKEIDFSVIRGNLAEIKILSGFESVSKGVDSQEKSMEDADVLAKNLAIKLNTVIAITGEYDYISNGKQVIQIKNGNEMLTKVTGTGCMTTSLIGTYCGITKDYFSASVGGIMTMGICGEKAAEKLQSCQGNGNYKVYILDEVYNLTPEDIDSRGKAYEV